MTFVESLEPRCFLSAAMAHAAMAHSAGHGRVTFTPSWALEGRASAAASSDPVVPIFPRTTGSSPAGYSPDQVRHAYGFDKISFSNGTLPGNGKGQTIAIIDAYDNPNIISDLAKFSTQFGLPAMDGKNGHPTFTKVRGTTTVNAGWALEEALDVEWAHAIAPLANIVLIEAKSSNLGDLLSAVDTARTRSGVAVVSMSWGANEFATEANYDYHFTTPTNHVPVTFVASSGDTGAPLEWPAASPKVVSVGGTTLLLNPDNTIAGETGWSGSGGGISAYETQPAYQATVASAWSTTRRTGPDVSYDADPSTGFAVYDSVAYSGQSGWFQVGGTSAGAPQWAALLAIVDQGRVAAGKKSLDGPTQALPAIYALPTSAFYDISSGSSTGTPSYAATSGYDLVTGTGSPHADTIAQLLLIK